MSYQAGQDAAAELRIEVWKRLTQGKRYLRIAEELGIHPDSVRRIAREERDRHKEMLAELVTQVQLEQVEQLRYIVDEALDAWRRSLQSTKKVKRSQGFKVNSPTMNGQTMGEGMRQDFDITNMESEETDGEIKYLQEARAAMNDMRTLLGANAPQQLQIGLGVQARLDVNLEDMDMTQLGGYMGELAKATQLLMGGGEVIDMEALPAKGDEDAT